METKELLDSLKTEWEEFKHLDSQRKDELASLGHETAETKQAMERVNDALIDLEAKFEKLSVETREAASAKSPAVKAFERWAQTGQLDPERKDITIVGDDSAAVLAPPELAMEMIQAAQLEEPILGLVRTRPTTRTSVKFPKRTALAVAVWDVDVADYTTEQTAPGFGVGEIVTYGSHAIVDIDAPSLDDTTFDLEGDLLTDWARAFAVIDGVAVVKGDGSSKPKGILTELTAVVERHTTAANTGLDYPTLLACVDSLKQAYRGNARWAMARTTVGKMRVLEDGAGNYIWSPDAAAGAAGTFLGYPYVLSENIDAVAATKDVLIFGDFKRGYWLVPRLEVEVQRDPYTQWPHVRFKARRRVGGAVVLGEALKAVTIKT